MRVFRYAVLGLLLWCVAGPVQAQQGSEPIVATDLLRIRQLGSVAVSPDGRQVVYTVTSVEEKPDSAGTYEYRTHLYLVPAGGSEAPRALTRGAQSASEPAWHPEGDRIAFVRQVEGKPQIFVLPLAGGEPYRLTQAEHGATNPRWSPGGTQILFTSSLPEKAVHEMTEEEPPWPAERPGRTPGDARAAEPDPDGTLAQVRAWLARNEKENNPRAFTRLDLQGELDLEPHRTYDHLFVIDAEEGAEPAAVTRGFYSFGGGAWLSDSRIVFHGAPVPDQHPDRVQHSDLYAVHTDGTGFQRLLSIDGYALFDPLVSPDGQTLAFLGRSLDDPGYAQVELGVFALDGRSEAQWRTLDFDRSMGDLRWSPDGWHLYFTAPSEGGFPLYRVPAFDVPLPAPAVTDTLEAALPSDTLEADAWADAEDVFLTDTVAAAVDTLAAAVDTVAAGGPVIEQITGPAQGVRSYDLSRATIFYVRTEAANPYELYATSTPFTEARRLTDHNASWLSEKRLSLPEAYTLRRDTLEIPYWIMRPAFYQEGRTYPLLVQIHGGPAAMWGPGEASMWHEFQFFAARGYGVVYSNPRGSGGYGYAFQRANYQDWGVGPAGDVLAVAAQAARQPWVDAERQVVTGGSYAGYLTAWIIAHDDRFKAAVAQRGVYDLATFLGEGKAWRLVPYHFGGYPWEDEIPPEQPSEPTLLIEAVPEPEAPDEEGDLSRETAEDVEAGEDEDAAGPRSVREVLFHNSPLTYVSQITTPLLIIHGDNDLRTGVTQSELLYKSLKILERPVEYVRYPKAGHELSRSGDPKQRIDRLLRIYEFMARFVE